MIGENNLMKKTILTVLAVVLSATAINAQSDTPFVGADLIVYNATITTQHPAQPEASAVAVKAGRIYAVGNDEEILSLKDNGTTVIDAVGKRLLPGLNDSHIHVLMEGVKYNLGLRWDGVPTLKIALEMLTEQAKRTPEGQWVKVIGGWSPYQFEERRLPTMAELNKAVPNRAFIVQYAYNVAFLNQMALDAIGADKKEFWVPPFTRFERDGNGKLTGMVYGEPSSVIFWMMESMVPQATEEVSENSLLQLFKELNRVGLTSVIDAGSSEGYPHPKAIQKVVAKNKTLPLRISFIDSGDERKGMTMVDEVIDGVTRQAPMSRGQNLHPTMEHGYEYEGVGEVISFTLLDFENFDHPPHVLDKKLIMDEITTDIAKLLKRRTPFRIHATYNENITVILDALEALDEKLPFDGLRWAIEHGEMISLENIKRVKKLGGGITIQAKMAFHGDAFIKTYGKEKALKTPPIRTILDMGVPTALGTDGLRVGSFNPWVTIYWVTTGKSVSGTEVLGKDNRLTREEALKLYTIGSAWFQYDEDEKGRIAPGQLADFIVLNKDYMTVPDEEILEIHSIMTVVDGRIVYGEGRYEQHAPVIPEPIPSWSPVKYYPGYYHK